MTDPTLMARLAEADPCREQAVSTDREEEAAADRLLAEIVATPPSDIGDRRPSRTRRVAFVAIGGIFAIASVVLLSDPLGDKSPGGEVLDRAVAAVSSDDTIYHIIERVTQTSTPDEDTLGYPYRTTSVRTIESWHSSDGRMRAVQYLHANGGRQLEVEVAGDSNTTRFYDPSVDQVREQPNQPSPAIADQVMSLDPFKDPGDQLRALRASGQLELAGEIDRDGKSAYLLKSTPRQGRIPDLKAQTVEFVVDQSDFLPITEVITSRSELDADDDVFEHPKQAEALRRAKRRGRTGITERLEREFIIYEQLSLDEQTARNLRLQHK